mmetsp:Transcript_6063/g.11918  ORF Transcript_6063/g.11918 Transcript_6063/m.11918 type:complete len:89 (-) Transcript_6063:1336-1602(-)
MPSSDPVERFLHITEFEVKRVEDDPSVNENSTVYIVVYLCILSNRIGYGLLSISFVYVCPTPSPPSPLFPNPPRLFASMNSCKNLKLV